MKIFQYFRLAPYAMAASSVLFCVGAVAEMPAGNYACQVQTVNDEKGLVLVQSDNKQQALAVARNGEAVTANGDRAGAARVVQCIDRRTERFTDADFQMQYMKTPL